MSEILFRFELSEALKRSAGTDDDELYEVYAVYAVPGRDGDKEIKWSNGSVIYGREEVDENIKEGAWIKVVEEVSE